MGRIQETRTQSDERWIHVSRGKKYSLEGGPDGQVRVPFHRVEIKVGGEGYEISHPLTADNLARSHIDATLSP